MLILFVDFFFLLQVVYWLEFTFLRRINGAFGVRTLTPTYHNALSIENELYPWRHLVDSFSKGQSLFVTKRLYDLVS